jgi:hypothetical protein
MEWFNDWIDAASIIHSCVTLNIVEKPFSLKKVTEDKFLYDPYPGLYDFISNLVKTQNIKKDLNIKEINS